MVLTLYRAWLILIVLPLLAACGRKTSQDQAGEATKEVIELTIGTQDTTINLATAGLVIREEKLLQKYLPRAGRYANVTFDVVWKNFTSGPPLTSEMIANKIDIGAMGDFPSVLNAAAFQKEHRRSLYVATVSASISGGGNGVVVPLDSPVQKLSELKGKQISVPFGSAAHGMLLRAIAALGWDPEKDVNLVSQSPEVGGTSLRSGKVDAHADFVPFAELFPFRGFARKIFDGASVNRPTSHGVVVRGDFAERHPEVVVAFLKALLDADRLVSGDPERYSELIFRVTGVDAEVNYMFHGPAGIQTRDFSIKPEIRESLRLAADTLRSLKRMESALDVDTFIDDKFIRQAAKEMGIDYDARLRNYDKLPLAAVDARTGAAIAEPKRAAQIWLPGEPKVKAYASIASALEALKTFEAQGKKPRVIYVHDRNSGLKLLANTAFYVRDAEGGAEAFLLKEDAQAWTKERGGSIVDFEKLKAGVI
jgi:NitT/TauT family transport system substrate-binding protein